ncbi:hypothetical protein GCM10023107_40970 [Actinoplanes octamycinicus]|nr:hypothetical protein Aoc01nite_86590 [Actinoplanes octamycinicus]
MFATPVRRRGEEKSRRAPDGGMARTVSVTWERVYAEDDGSRACPSVDRPATPRLLDLTRTASRGAPDQTSASLRGAIDLVSAAPRAGIAAG